MSDPVPAAIFQPETDRSYLVFCPDQGGWHVGEWWTVESAGHWVAVIDAEIRLHPSHVMDAPADPMDALGTLHWIMADQLPAAGTA